MRKMRETPWKMPSRTLIQVSDQGVGVSTLLAILAPHRKLLGVERLPTAPRPLQRFTGPKTSTPDANIQENARDLAISPLILYPEPL